MSTPIRDVLPSGGRDRGHCCVLVLSWGYCIKANISGGGSRRGPEGWAGMAAQLSQLSREACDGVLKRMEFFSLFCGLFFSVLATGGTYCQYLSNKSFPSVPLCARHSGCSWALAEKAQGCGFGSEQRRGWCCLFPSVNGCPEPGHRQLYVNVLHVPPSLPPRQAGPCRPRGPPAGWMRDCLKQPGHKGSRDSQ